jgi:hypothetical protein
MLATYGIDTLDPAVSTRRVWVLLERLPPAARRPGEQWSTEAELLALLIDHVADLTWVTARAYGSKGSRPKPLPRPAARQDGPPQPDAPRPTSSWADAIRALAGVPGVVVTTDAAMPGDGEGDFKARGLIAGEWGTDA